MLSADLHAPLRGVLSARTFGLLPFRGWLLCGLAACAPKGAASDAVDTDPGADTDRSDDTDPMPDTDVPDTDDTDPHSDIHSDDATDDTDSTDETDPPAPSSSDLRNAGPELTERTTGTLTTTSGCDLAWVRFRPQGAGELPLVVLTHGLQRTKEQMAVWAEHLATWGLDVVAPSSCLADVWNIDQETNGRDNIELATSLGATSVVYAGHSAGGLASWFAASLDARTIGLFGLDPVDVGGRGVALSADITVPTLGLWGDDGTCNVWGSAPILLAAVPASQRLRVVDADHCDFEQPTGPVCTLACGRSPNTRFTEVEIRATVRGMMTAALRAQVGLTPDADEWWKAGGAWYDHLLREGSIAP